MALDETRYSSAVTLVRLLAGAEPITRHHAALDTALERLKTASETDEIERLDRMIWRMWRGGGNRAAVGALNRALQALATGDFGQALRALDDSIAADLLFAEGWNRRATVYFLLSEHAKAVSDIEHVLILEPRHYGALSGLGQILLQDGDPAGALVAFEAALEVNPHLVRVREVAGRIRSTLPQRTRQQHPRLN